MQEQMGGEGRTGGWETGLTTKGTKIFTKGTREVRIGVLDGATSKLPNSEFQKLGVPCVAPCALCG
jgi:hypothetical protein